MSHVTHCCERHGCKYGDDQDCPVASSFEDQDYPCFRCIEPEKARRLRNEAMAEWMWSNYIYHKTGAIEHGNSTSRTGT